MTKQHFFNGSNYIAPNAHLKKNFLFRDDKAQNIKQPLKHKCNFKSEQSIQLTVCTWWWGQYAVSIYYLCIMWVFINSSFSRLHANCSYQSI